jgi:pyridoxamine 5'-phosphate oxidase
MASYEGKLRRRDLADDPFEQFAAWFTAAEEKVPLADAMVLATVGGDGAPAARFVLLKGFSADGFMFHTDYRSPKARQLEENPRAALAFWWSELGRQVRVSGPVEKLSGEESDRYFETRPRERQLGAWASHQSQPVESREALDALVDEAAERFGEGAPPRPEHWGGFRLLPEEVEFWQQGTDRLHDRFRYRREGEGWAIERLSP